MCSAALPLYADEYAGRGLVTEAVQQLVDYLFGVKKEHRIHLVIVGENVASRRIAENAASCLKEPFEARFSTAVATRTYCSTPC